MNKKERELYTTEETSSSGEEQNVSVTSEENPYDSNVNTEQEELPESYSFVDVDGTARYIRDKEEYEEAEREKAETLKYWKIQKIKKVVIIAGIVICITGVIFAIKRNKDTEEVAVTIETVEESTKTEDLNIPIGGLDGQGKGVEALLGDEPAIVFEVNESEDMDSNNESTSESLSETPKTEGISSESLPEATKAVAPEKDPTKSTSDIQNSIPETEAPVPVEKIDTSEKVQEQIQELQTEPQTMPAEIVQDLDDYYRRRAESIVADPEYQRAVQESLNAEFGIK